MTPTRIAVSSVTANTIMDQCYSIFKESSNEPGMLVETEDDILSGFTRAPFVTVV
jgi:hypothetical protein